MVIMADKPASKFQKPAWLLKKQAATLSQPTNTVPPESTEKHKDADIFSRAKDTEIVIRAEKERKEKRRRERKEREERERQERAEASQRQSIEVWADETERLSREPESKRRRISTQEEDAPFLKDTPSSRSGTPPCLVMEKPAALAPTQVVIEDSDGDGDSRCVPSISRNGKAPVKAALSPLAPSQEIIIIMSDDEDTSTAREKTTTAVATDPELSDVSEDEGPNPVMTLFIHPRIPGTQPLLVQRKYTQKLKEVRKAWCMQNQLSQAQELDCIFTWNNKRLFDVQSCKDLGIKVDEDGVPYIVTEDEVHATLENIVLEATTRKIWEDDKQQAQRKLLLALQPSTKVFEESDQPIAKEPEYKVILKSRDYPDVKLKLKRDTTMERLAEVFRTRTKCPDNLNVCVVFDGDELAPSLQVKDAEFMDDYEEDEVLSLEIHVR